MSWLRCPPGRLPDRGRAARRALCAAAAVAGLAACTPALDWRELRPDGGALRLQFPCKPQKLDRRVDLGGVPVPMSLLACRAQNLVFGLARADVGDPSRVGGALQALLRSAEANIGIPDSSASAAPGAPASEPFAPKGATPQAEARRAVRVGRLPDGAAVELHVAVFAYGTQVYQATVVARAGDPGAAEAVRGWHESLRFEAR